MFGPALMAGMKPQMNPYEHRFAPSPRSAVGLRSIPKFYAERAIASADSIHQYFAHPAAMTAADRYAKQFDDLPTDLAQLCAAVQGLLIHRDWAPIYGVAFSDDRKPEVQIRPVSEMLEQIFALDDRPLKIARAPERRLFTVCRHFALLLCAILRHREVPARTRVGFGTYFTPGKFEDHWVCEYWNAAEARWVLVDPQLDPAQLKFLKPDFSPLDVPRNRFVIGGDAWQMCRNRGADPARFGIWDLRGSWFIRGNVVRDFAALNRVELLPWDASGALMRGPEADTTPSAEENAFVDRIAALSLAGDDAFGEIRATYDGDDRLRVPREIRSFTDQGPQTVTIET